MRAISPAADRLAMVDDAVAGLEGIEVSRLEIDRGGPSYTVDTVEELLGEARGLDRTPPELFVIVGSDLVAGLGTWERVDDLRRLVTLVVVSRPHSPAPGPPAGMADRAGRGPRDRRLELRGPGPGGRGPVPGRTGPRAGDPLHSAQRSVRCSEMTASSADTAEIPVAGRTAFVTAPREAPPAGPVIDEATAGPRIEPQFLPPLGGLRPVGTGPSAFAPGLDVTSVEPPSSVADDPKTDPVTQAAPVHPSALAAPATKRRAGPSSRRSASRPGACAVATPSSACRCWRGPSEPPSPSWTRSIEAPVSEPAGAVRAGEWPRRCRGRRARGAHLECGANRAWRSRGCR